MRVLLVDDHALLRQSLGAYLVREDPALLVGQAGGHDEAMRECAHESYDAVVTDISMEGKTGIELIKRLAADRPSLPIVALSMHEDIEHLVAALRAGARGYVAKSSDASELRSAIMTVSAGRIFLDQRMLALVISRLAGIPTKEGPAEGPSLSALTDRERDVFVQLAKNATIEEIGAALSISPKTVENHRGAIYAKLGISDRLSLYHYARRLGLAD